MKVILYTDNDYRISTNSNRLKIDDPNLVWLEHLCNHRHWGQAHWRIMWCDVKSRGRRCKTCQRSASDGLQAVFWFLKSDQA